MTARLRPRSRRRGPAVAGVLAAVGLWAAPASAAGGLALPGTELKASSSAGAPTKVTAGVYRVVVGPGDGGHRYLTYHRTIRESTVHVSVLASEVTTSGDGVSVAVTDPSGDTCDTDTASGYAADALAFTAVVSVGQAVDDLEQPAADQPACVRASDLDIELGRGFSSGSGDLTVSVRVLEEAPVTTVRSLPTELTENAAFTAPETGSAVTSQADGTLARPEGLNPGHAVTGTLRTGTAAVYAVRGDVGWGQRLDAQVVTGPVDGVSFATLGVRILDPMASPGRTDSDTGYVSESTKAVATASAGPVRYRNRFGNSGPYLPGTYLVVVGVAGQASPRDVPFTLKVQIGGQVSGVPAYVGGADHAFVVTGTHRTGTPSADDGGWTPLRGAAVGLLALVGLAGVGGGTVLLRRR